MLRFLMVLDVNGTTSNNTSTNQQDDYRIGKKYWKYVKARKRETVGVSTLKVNGDTIENSKGKAEGIFHLDVKVFDGMYWSIALKRCDLKVVQYPSMFISLYFSLKLSSLLSRYSLTASRFPFL
jgi:hypothetical protein